MSYSVIKAKARTRFNETQIYLNYLKSLEPSNPTDPISLELKIMKGLFQVHLYAAFEKTVNELIENTLLYIGSNNVQYNHYCIPFNTISLVDQLKSFKDSGQKSFFEKAIEIFSEMTSSNIASINETAFSNQLQNVWTKAIEEVVKSFGIKSFSLDHRVRATIDELVDKRNAVAHGRESATVIGERFRTDVLQTKLDTVVLFSNQLIDLFENYYANKHFLKGHAKKNYTVTI